MQPTTADWSPLIPTLMKKGLRPTALDELPNPGVLEGL